MPKLQLTYTKPTITGEQYLAMIDGEEMDAASEAFLTGLAQLGAPEGFLFSAIPLLGRFKQAIVKALVEFSEADAEAAIRKYKPQVAADFDAGIPAFVSAMNEIASDADAGQTTTADSLKGDH